MLRFHDVGLDDFENPACDAPGSLTLSPEPNFLGLVQRTTSDAFSEGATHEEKITQVMTILASRIPRRDSMLQISVSSTITKTPDQAIVLCHQIWMLPSMSR